MSPFVRKCVCLWEGVGGRGRGTKDLRKGLESKINGSKINASTGKRCFWKSFAAQESHPRWPSRKCWVGHRREGHLVLSRSPRGTGGCMLLEESANHTRVPGGKTAAQNHIESYRAQIPCHASSSRARAILVSFIGFTLSFSPFSVFPGSM